MYSESCVNMEWMPSTSLQDVFHATVMSKMLYCCQAWSGFCSAADRQRLDSFIRRCIKFGYCAPDPPPIESLFMEADENLFHEVLRNSHHTLYPLLPPPADRTYNLLQRKHNRSLITKTAHSTKTILLYDCCTETYTDGHAVLMFLVF